jgi:SPP1 gp7 family putative phage head morphogenesis protein
MEHTNWQLRRRIERQYAAAIDRLLRGLRPQLSEVRSPFLLQQVIQNYARSPTFKKRAYEIARAMATHVFSDGHRTWREAARAGSKGRVIYRILERELQSTQVGTTYYNIVQRNADLISSVPASLAQKITERAANVYATGSRYGDLAGEILAMYPRLSKSHATLIARTETSKASTALTQARAAAAGLDWYVWRTSEDQRVRDSHSLMEGVLVSWAEPPSPEELNHEKSYGHYHAGDIFNCRCYPQPLLEYGDVTWPAKVYWQGRVQRLTLSRFRAITGGEL